MNSDRPSTTRQSTTPLFDRLQASAQSGNSPFHTPGHHKGQGIESVLKSAWGAAVFQADLPELPELDNLFAPEGVIAESQELAAEAWGSDRTFFLANGSTAGVIASILAVCSPGDEVLIPRNVHRSVISGLILSGASPIFLMPEVDVKLGIAHGVTVETIESHLISNPRIKAVLIINPTYYGVCSDLVSIANLVHRYGLPLIVDEAHGAHFQFHPALPIAALTANADLVIQSTHKTLSALTQASMLHLKGALINPGRLMRALELVQSTSPSYLLLASLDVARMQMATQGEMLLGEAIDRVMRLRSKIRSIPYLQTLEFKPSPGFFKLDPLRLTVFIDGMTGFDADEILHESLGVTCELPGLQSLTFIITHGTTEQDCDRLLQALQQLSDRVKHQIEHHETNHFDVRIFEESPTLVLSPRDAFFADSKAVSIEAAIGQVSAELICPYPPGIPVLMPGERITAGAIEYLQRIVAAGGCLTGAEDGTIETIRVMHRF
jgi:arginine decarboxylase